MKVKEEIAVQNKMGDTFTGFIVNGNAESHTWLGMAHINKYLKGNTDIIRIK